MHITLTQSDIKRIIKDTEAEIENLEILLTGDKAQNDIIESSNIAIELVERQELVQYLRYNIKLNTRDGKK